MVTALAVTMHAGATPFVDNKNGTVIDGKTGLIWQQGEGGAMGWTKAFPYCENLSLAGYTDWRLPNIKELESLVDKTRQNPTLDQAFFPDAHASPYWSSTTHPSQPKFAWHMDFSNGRVSNNTKYYSMYARCVRGSNSDIWVAKNDSPNLVLVGNNVTYTITATNNGPSAATGVTLTDILPGGVTFVSANSTQGACNETGGTVTCDVGNVEYSKHVAITIVVTAPDAPGTITNTATVASTSNDPDLKNNTCTKETTVNPHVVTASAEANGSLDATTPSPTSVNHNSSASFKFNATEGYHIAAITETCGGPGYANTSNAVTTYTYTTPAITSNCRLIATFAINNIR